jgi:hypothetical protein
MPRVIVRALSGLMAVLFLFSALVQYNDPDPWTWMTFYGAAAIVSGWAAFRPSAPLVGAALIVALAGMIWAATIAPRVVGHVGWSELYTEFGMKSQAVEEGREMTGLLVVVAWMVALALAHRRRGVSSSP